MISILDLEEKNLLKTVSEVKFIEANTLRT